MAVLLRPEREPRVLRRVPRTRRRLRPGVGRRPQAQIQESELLDAGAVDAVLELADFRSQKLDPVGHIDDLSSSASVAFGAAAIATAVYNQVARRNDIMRSRWISQRPSALGPTKLKTG